MVPRADFLCGCLDGSAQPFATEMAALPQVVIPAKAGIQCLSCENA
jgi:hypothetical protein